ncbi:2-oxoglutarate oxidoreductase subunit KorB [BD1-7 clade bacterium]|uniref:2-oxoglutarate oxidoreductase subunit KorB n=1 Tax=BD1-7 clade bacterium TaxID=2029982 RepID=A0A5S9QPF4_9GAMM|nr:2-oxoglutarate oxidoreductase subunit KorB [BD1-7 clade bacterium]
MPSTADQIAVHKPKDYKSAVKPIWCAGCGHYAVLAALARALAELNLPPEKVAIISGIGCSSRLPAYTQLFGFHGVHGRALPVAAGLKAARPDLLVIAVGGDGDGFSIGGNHFLHACRRNVDFTYIAMDNEVYGMTKGQASPTTPKDWDHSKLTPHGTGIPALQPASLALGSGAGFIARGFYGDPNQLKDLIIDAIKHQGFSFVQALSQCVTFVPEQKHWKEQVHPFESTNNTDGPSTAADIHSDDGFGLGVIYRDARPAWEPFTHSPENGDEEKRAFDDMEATFSITR